MSAFFATATTQMAQEAPPPGIPIVQMLFFMAFIVLMYQFIYARPMAKDKERHTKMINSLIKGDKIVSIGGIHGEIVEVQEGLASFINWLVEDQRLNETNSVISDRTFLVKSLKLIKANAVINNRGESDLSDLKVLRFLLPFRVPEDILEAAEQKLESFENQKKKTKN